MRNVNSALVMGEGDYAVKDFDWGRLTWFASKDLRNSQGLTVGRCEILPGRENPYHAHPNCEEVLHVLAGTIVHRIDGADEVAMGPGDTISVPPSLRHNARNIGEERAVLLVCFSSAERQTVNA